MALAEGLTPTASSSSNGSTISRFGQVSAGGASQLEAVVHQHLPIFHTEHCVFCRCVGVLGCRSCCLDSRAGYSAWQCQQCSARGMGCCHFSKACLNCMHCLPAFGYIWGDAMWLPPQDVGLYVTALLGVTQGVIGHLARLVLSTPPPLPSNTVLDMESFH